MTWSPGPLCKEMVPNHSPTNWLSPITATKTNHSLPHFSLLTHHLVVETTDSTCLPLVSLPLFWSHWQGPATWMLSATFYNKICDTVLFKKSTQETCIHTISTKTRYPLKLSVSDDYKMRDRRILHTVECLLCSSCIQPLLEPFHPFRIRFKTNSIWSRSFSALFIVPYWIGSL